MSRLINADDILSRAHDVTLKNGAKHRCFDVTMLHEIPTVETLEWILCKERLPEANGRYLVTRGLNACGALWNRTYILNYSDLMGLKSEKIWWSGNPGKNDFEKYTDVLAWMELPKAYGKD